MINAILILYFVMFCPQPRTEEDKLAGRMEVKRYRQTKEKLRRRRERLLQKVRLLASRPPRATDLPRDVKVEAMMIFIINTSGLPKY